MRIVRTTTQSDEQIVAEVARCVQSGGTLIFPTETVYGIGCGPENEAAIAAVYRAKARDEKKPLALHVADFEQAAPFVGKLDARARLAIEKFWPGPLALIVSRKPGRYERAACGLATISLRCPSHELCRRILSACGPLAATSANSSGQAPFVGREEEIASLPEATMAVLAGPTALRRESTILDCTNEPPLLLREGALPAATIAAALGTLRTLR